MEQRADVPTSTPLDSWLARLGQSTGAPGGGAASGVMIGIAAALLGMVASYTPDDPLVAECDHRLERLRNDALDAAEADGIASAGFGSALALPDDDPTRDARVRQAALDAAASSARLGAVGVRLIDEVRLLRERGNPHLAADLAVAAAALASGIAGASVNLRANLRVADAHHAQPDELRDLRTEDATLSAAHRLVTGMADELSAEFDH